MYSQTETGSLLHLLQKNHVHIYYRKNSALIQFDITINILGSKTKKGPKISLCY